MIVNMAGLNKDQSPEMFPDSFHFYWAHGFLY